MKIGDIVKPTKVSGYQLASGCGRYDYAVVANLEPFVLVSVFLDMKWEATIKPEYFEVLDDVPFTVSEDFINQVKARSGY